MPLKFSYFLKYSILFCLIVCAYSCREKILEHKPWTKVRTVAGLTDKFGEPFGVAVKADEVYISDGEKNSIFKVSKDGKLTALTDKLDTPSQIAFDKNGDLIVADTGSHTIKKVKSNGEIELIAGIENTQGFQDGNAKAALFNAPIGVAIAEDKIYVADTYNDRIRVIENGTVSTLAGGKQGFGEGTGDSAKFDTPCGLAISTDSRILVADTGNRRIRVVETNGATWTLAGNGSEEWKDGKLSDAVFVRPTAITISDSGAIFVTDGNAVRSIGARSFPIVETVSNDWRGFSDGELLRAKFNRPSGLAFDLNGNLFVTDSENQVLRVYSGEDFGKEITAEDKQNLRFKPEEFRKLAPPRWTYDPPEAKREIAGTLGEIRGEIAPNKQAWFHNGLDIAGGFGETARFIRDEKVLQPVAAEGFDGLRERLRMPTIGYIHIRLGRDKENKIYDDPRFIFSKNDGGKLSGIRVPRGAKFKAGQPLGTLNSFNHVHLIAGRTGAEMNALDALILPGISDTVAPKIEKISLFDENWMPFETTNSNSRITVRGKTRIVLRGFDQMNGNESRRKLGIYKLGYQVLQADETPVGDKKWTISFDRTPDEKAVPFVYAKGSQSGYTPETIFNYIVTNEVEGDDYREKFFDSAALENGNYILRVFAADFFGNSASEDIKFEVNN